MTTDESIQTLSDAAATGNIAGMKRALELGAYINEKSDYKTALFYAIKYRQTEAIQFLIEHGADISIKSYDADRWMSPIYKAHMMNYAEAIQLLYKAIAQLPPNETWAVQNNQEIALISRHADLENTRSLTTIFNFARRQITTFAGAHDNSPVLIQSFDAVEKSYVREAFNHFTAQGGVADEAFVIEGKTILKERPPQLTRG